MCVLGSYNCYITKAFLNSYTFSCLLYKYLSLDGFPAVAGVDAVCRLDNRLPRGCPMEQLTPSHPWMAMCSGNDVSSTSASSLAWWQSSLNCLVLCIHLGRLSKGCCTEVHLSCSISVGAVLACPVPQDQKQCLAYEQLTKVAWYLHGTW